MQEQFLHYLWKYRLYKPGLYSTTQGEPLEIIHPGLHNTDSGPDFFNAKIKIGDTLWAGNVEIHQKTSDWNRHGHQTNAAYDNVILHVVAQHDLEVANSSGVLIPSWEMPIDDRPLKNYETLLKNQNWIACAPYLEKINPLELYNWIERMTIEKLEGKIAIIRQMLEQYQNNWDEVFYLILVRNFGFGINSQPFEQLARNTPWIIILKNNDNLPRLEALFLGQAGFLSNLIYEDDYVQLLQREYKFLTKKYHLTALPQHHWKFLRLRPSNFPTIRLVQLARLFYNGNISFSRVLQVASKEDLTVLFTIEAGDYWNTHYRPGAESANHTKHLGKSSVELLLINTIVPMLFAYGKLRGYESLCNQAISWLESTKPESNNIIHGWNKSGIIANHAGHSQGLVYLKQQYCQHRKCLHCRIGHLVISKQNR